MLTDPAAAAWVAAGEPNVDAPAPVPGRCGRCGTDGPTVTSSRIVSEKFTGFDAWPFGSRRLCVPCAWAYSSQQLTSAPALLISTTAVTEYPNRAHLTTVLTTGALPTTQAAVLPTASRRHILPSAEWGHLAIDGLVIPWTAGAAEQLADLVWLRAIAGAVLPRPWAALTRAAPPPQLLSAQPADLWARVLDVWSALQPWRNIPPLWDAARILTNPL